MEFPTRSIQQKNESDSFAVLIYKLRSLGIFRNLTQSDYGIDFEIELVNEKCVTGRYVKVQVKSSEKLKIRAEDGVPTVGGIKQSTLWYWTELSYSTHVLVFAVDLKSEKIYLTKPMFWSAVSLLDPDDRTKTIEFVPIPDNENSDAIVKGLVLMFMHGVPLLEEINRMKYLFANVPDIIQIYLDAICYDYFEEVSEPHRYRNIFDYCNQLQIAIEVPNDENFDENDKKNILNYDYWSRLSGEKCHCPTNGVIVRPLQYIIPALISRIAIYRKRVINSSYYWIQKDQDFLSLAYSVALPDQFDKEYLASWVEKPNNPTDYDLWICSKISEWEREIEMKNTRLESKKSRNEGDTE